MTRTLKTDIPGPDWRRELEDLRERGPLALFRPELAHPKRLVLEIGFGRGEFIAALALAEPDTAFLAVELSHKRVLKMARRTAKSALANLRLIEARGEDVLALLPLESVEECWINFPDPWPKKRHARRRLIQPELLSMLAARLVLGGVVYLATDHVPYAEQMHEVLSREPELENVYAPAPWQSEVPGRMRTAYELEWRAEGRPLHFFAYRRRAA